MQSSREEYEEPDTERDSLFHRSYYMERPEEEAVVGPSVSPMKSSSERKVHVSSWLNSYQKIKVKEELRKEFYLTNIRVFFRLKLVLVKSTIPNAKKL